MHSCTTNQGVSKCLKPQQHFIREDTRTLFQDAASWLHLDDPLPMGMAWSKMGIEPLSTGEAFIDVQGAVYFEVAKGKRVRTVIHYQA